MYHVDGYSDCFHFGTVNTVWTEVFVSDFSMFSFLFLACLSGHSLQCWMGVEQAVVPSSPLPRLRGKAFSLSLLSMMDAVGLLHIYLWWCGSPWRLQLFSSCGARTDFCVAASRCGSRAVGCVGSVPVAHGISCPKTGGSFLDQESNLCPLHLAERFFFFFNVK